MTDRPLSDHAKQALGALSIRAQPRQTFNPGVAALLERRGFVETYWHRSPYKPKQQIQLAAPYFRGKKTGVVMSITARERHGLGDCRNCLFFNYREDDPKALSGYCRRFPPIMRDDDSLSDGFPNVRLTDWCGEFKKS